MSRALAIKDAASPNDLGHPVGGPSSLMVVAGWRLRPTAYPSKKMEELGIAANIAKSPELLRRGR